MIFDEATSALDKRNEREVQASIEAMGKELGGVTTVVIAHRLSTIRNADKIIVLKKGVLAEQGNHDELMALNGEYSKLIKLQGAKEEAKKNQLTKQLSNIDEDADKPVVKPVAEKEDSFGSDSDDEDSKAMKEREKQVELFAQ
jgi:ABC-type multidrug transport system ATPase subunit